MNIYELDFKSRCPNNDDVDDYTVQFIGLDFVEVEKIVSHLTKYKSQHKFQEVIADEIAKDYPCRIVIVGYHQGVKITTVRNYD